MNFSPQQQAALKQCGRWIQSQGGPQVFRLFGFAGTGKTTLAKYLVQHAPGRWLFAAYTGKASHVLRQKGCFDAATIHSLIYRPAGESKASELLIVETRIAKLLESTLDTFPNEEQQKELKRLEESRIRLLEDNQIRFALWEGSPLGDPDVRGIVVDEVSMVDQDLARDLESFGKKVLVLGDPAQLPPVGGGGYYTNAEPDVMLTEIHRHARESGILNLATYVREGGDAAHWIQNSSKDCLVLFRQDYDREELAKTALNADQVLCGLNRSRHSMNHRYRELLGRKTVGPIPEDRLVCLKNYKNLGLFNGSQWKVVEATNDLSSKTTDMTIVSEDFQSGEIRVAAWLHHMIGATKELDQLGFERRDLCEFDWSYALTVHKAQGSQWNKVMVFDESAAFPAAQRKRWLYTAITRASKELVVVI